MVCGVCVCGVNDDCVGMCVFVLFWVVMCVVDVVVFVFVVGVLCVLWMMMMMLWFTLL